MVLSKTELSGLLQNEVRILLHLISKIDRAKLDYRPTAKQRSTPVANAILYAFDAATGKELYSSQKLIDSWTHYGGLAIAKGRVYVTTWDARVYCFGLPQ